MNNKKRSAEAGTYMADTRNHLQSTIISEQCQMESYRFIKADRSKRKAMILKALGDAEMTAREIAYKLEFSDLNRGSPSLYMKECWK